MENKLLEPKLNRPAFLVCLVIIEHKEGQLSSPNENEAANDQQQNKSDRNSPQWPKIGVLYEPPPPEKIKKGKPIKRVQTEPIPPNEHPLNKPDQST